MNPKAVRFKIIEILFSLPDSVLPTLLELLNSWLIETDIKGLPEEYQNYFEKQNQESSVLLSQKPDSKTLIKKMLKNSHSIEYSYKEHQERELKHKEKVFRDYSYSYYSYLGRALIYQISNTFPSLPFAIIFHELNNPIFFPKKNRRGVINDKICT